MRDRTFKLVIGDQVIIKDNTKGSSGTASDPTAMSFLLHARQIDNFINAVLGKEKLMIDAEEGRRAIALIEEIYEKSDS